MMRRLVCFALLIGALAGHAGAVQRGVLRELVRTSGRDMNRVLWNFMPPTGLQEVVAMTEWTIEGTIVQADAALYEGPREEFVYTDFVIEVSRVLRSPTASTRATPGATISTPFLPTVTATGATSTPRRIRVRALNHGRVAVEGGSISDRSDFPALRVGQHVITSAHFNADLGEWIPFGVFEVRDGRVMALAWREYMLDYDSVDAFAVALANPPATVVRVR